MLSVSLILVLSFILMAYHHFIEHHEKKVVIESFKLMNHNKKYYLLPILITTFFILALIILLFLLTGGIGREKFDIALETIRKKGIIIIIISFLLTIFILRIFINFLQLAVCSYSIHLYSKNKYTFINSIIVAIKKFITLIKVNLLISFLLIIDIFIRIFPSVKRFIKTKVHLEKLASHGKKSFVFIIPIISHQSFTLSEIINKSTQLVNQVWGNKSKKPLWSFRELKTFSGFSSLNALIIFVILGIYQLIKEHTSDDYLYLYIVVSLYLTVIVDTARTIFTMAIYLYKTEDNTLGFDKNLIEKAVEKV